MPLRSAVRLLVSFLRGPSGGVFWPTRAESEATRANDQLGPNTPSLPSFPTARY